MSKGKKTPYQKNSFQNMVEERANQKAVQMLQTVVDQKIGMAMAQLTQRLMTSLAEILYRVRFLEEKVGISNEEREQAVLKYQDEAWGLTQVDRAAQKGDFLRVTYSINFDGKNVVEAKAGLIDDLLKENYSPNDLPKGAHEALLGKVVGETTTYTDEMPTGNGDETKPIEYSLTVDRISEKLAKKEETNEASNDSGKQDNTEETEEGTAE